jgi:hypothetical protein
MRRGAHTLLSPLETANLKAFSKGPNRIGVSPTPHLRTETDPVSETVCFLVSRIPNDGQSPPVILSVIHHRQNPSESTPR